MIISELAVVRVDGSLHSLQVCFVFIHWLSLPAFRMACWMGGNCCPPQCSWICAS